MSTKARTALAVKAMKGIGIPEKRVRPVLKNLLKLYDKNWELIEDENYRVLADAIFEYQEIEVEEAKKNIESQLHDETTEPLSKRLRSRQRADRVSPSDETSFKRPKLEEAHLPQHFPREERAEPFHLYHRDKRDEHEPILPQMHLREKRKEPASPQACSSQESSERSLLHLREKGAEPEHVSLKTHFMNKGKEPVLSPQTYQMQKRAKPSSLCFKDNRAESDSVSPQAHLRFKGKEPISLQPASSKRGAVAKRSSSVLRFKEPKVEPGIVLLPKEKLLSHHHNDGLVKPQRDPGLTSSGALPDPVHEEGCSVGNDSLISRYADAENENDGISDKACKTRISLELANIPELSPNFEIASSPLGEVKISLSCNYALELQDFHMPALDAVLKIMEDKCHRSYKVLEPSFSLTRLMKELCQCFLETGNDSTNDKESFMHTAPNLNLLKKSYLQNALGAKGDNWDDFYMPACSLNGPLNFHSSMEVVVPEIPSLLAPNGLDGNHHIVQLNQKVHAGTDERDKEQKDPDSSSPRSLVLVPQENFTIDDEIPLHDINDIAKGEERVKISLVNEVSSKPYPPAFYYIPRNMVYLKARVNFSFARIGDEDCCSNCFGDCLSSSIPCACARETAGEFAYTPEGLIKERFLDECISMYRDPSHLRRYCNDCPLERFKNENFPDPCKGHLARKFIKECWSKCSCSKQCGNRVVQRGITCNLQVFFTSEGKGWGLRTLEDLPRGTFVCEYAGEILTNTELYERNAQSTGNERNMYPVPLDADWGSEGVLKDEEALFLDASIYGNVARFINHRCFDANLVEIPVEVETPNHHYYHLALFTTRKVDALEELTWDYGIDFNDYNQPVKAFRCHCGSECCRNMKRKHRAKSKAVIF